MFAHAEVERIVIDKLEDGRVFDGIEVRPKGRVFEGLEVHVELGTGSVHYHLLLSYLETTLS